MPRNAFAFAFALLLVVSAACTRSSPAPSPEPTPTQTPAQTPASPNAEPTGSPPASVAPDLPPGIPPFFESDVAADDVPPAALIPLRTEVTGAWHADTSEGEAILVAWLEPGPDPLSLAHGIVLWRRFDDGGAPWRPVFGARYPKRTSIFGISAQTADVTGDASDDALVFLQTGGTGACGTYLVLDAAAGSERFARDVCDTTIEPSTDPVGLLMVEAVYEPGDPHCCPSAMRRSVLVSEDTGWTTVSEKTSSF